MKSQNTKAIAAQGANVATTITNNANANADLFAMFQQFIAAQQAMQAPAPTVIVATESAPVKSKAKASKKTGAIVLGKTSPADNVLMQVVKAKAAEKKAEVFATGALIFPLENSFFVYGDQAPAKLAGFFARKPHLDRGFKLHEIKGLGLTKAYWFGGKQLPKIKKALGIA